MSTRSYKYLKAKATNKTVSLTDARLATRISYNEGLYDMLERGYITQKILNKMRKRPNKKLYQ